MEYLHIIPAKTGEITEFLKNMESRINLNEHKFMTLVSKTSVIKFTPGLLAYPFIEFFEKRTGKFSRMRNFYALWKRLKKADVLIWHSLDIDSGKFTILLFIDKSLVKKSVWIENGYDEESWTQYSRKLKCKIFNHISSTVRKNIPIVGCSFGANKEYVKSLWPDKQIFDTPYPVPKEYVYMPSKEELAEKQDRITKFLEALENTEEEFKLGKASWPNIQVGLNSQNLNKHALILDNIKKFKKIQQNVYLPVNHKVKKLNIGSGVKAYRERIKKKAKSDWHDNCIVIERTVSIEAYKTYLSNLDVVLCGAEVCFSLSYLLLLIASGAKLFLRQSSFLYLYLKDNGFPVYAIEDIKDMEYRDFILQEKTDEIPLLIKQHFDSNYVMDCWKNLFSSLRDSAV